MVQLDKDMICRVCARSGCTPLSDKIDGNDIMSTIRSLTNVSIEVDDSLPKYICTNCLKLLKFALNFKKTCEASDKEFREILYPTGNHIASTFTYFKYDYPPILHQIKLPNRKKQEKKPIKTKIRIKRILRKKTPKFKPPIIKQFKCSPCDLTFPNEEELMSHHRKLKCLRRACAICSHQVLDMAQHMRYMHKESTPYKCTTCGKEYPVIARLRNHMHIHTNTFKFYCDLCPYKCKHKHYLVLHMRTHTGEKPFKCAQCPATFMNPSNLNNHKLKHQEKQFKCLECEKAFRTNTALREHKEAAHMNIKHKCNSCERQFRYKSDVRKHERRSHNRVTRGHVGAEPTYKQLEKLQKNQENEAKDKRARKV